MGPHAQLDDFKELHTPSKNYFQNEKPTLIFYSDNNITLDNNTKFDKKINNKVTIITFNDYISNNIKLKNNFIVDEQENLINDFKKKKLELNLNIEASH